jgi:hypothetical protein
VGSFMLGLSLARLLPLRNERMLKPVSLGASVSSGSVIRVVNVSHADELRRTLARAGAVERALDSAIAPSAKRWSWWGCRFLCIHGMCMLHDAWMLCMRTLDAVVGDAPTPLCRSSSSNEFSAAR